MYAIRLLEKNIEEHRKEIKRLENIEYELTSDVFFAQSEIKERKGYIQQLQNAINRLTIACSDKELMDFTKQLLKQKK